MLRDPTSVDATVVSMARASDRGRRRRPHRPGVQPGPARLPGDGRPPSDQARRRGVLPAVGDGILRALRDRPTTLERWPDGVHEGVELATGRRDGDAFYQKRIPQGRPGLGGDRADHVPQRPHRRRGLPDRAGRRGLGARRWARSRSIPGRYGAPTSTTPTSCASTSTRSRAPTSPTPCGSPAWRASCSTSWAARLPQDVRATGACTSTSGSSRAGPSPTYGTRAIAFGRELERRMPDRVTTNVVEGGARRADLRRLQPERPRPHDRLAPTAVRPMPARPGLHAAARGTSWPRSRPARPRPSRVPDAVRRARRPARRRSTTSRTPSSRCWSCTRATRRARPRRHALPAGLPEDARRATGVQPSKKNPLNWENT